MLTTLIFMLNNIILVKRQKKFTFCSYFFYNFATEIEFSQKLKHNYEKD